MKVLVKDVLTPAVLLDAALMSGLGTKAAEAFSEVDIPIEVLFDVDGDGHWSLNRINKQPILKASF